MDKLVEKLIELCSVPGVSGREEKVRQHLIEKLEVPHRVDNVGNLIVELGEGEKTVALMAHMDEIGLIVTGVNNDGTLNFRKVGGFDDRILAGSHIQVVTESGILEGVIGITPPHLSSQQTTENLRIDIGCRSKDEAEALGVKVLDYAVFKKHASLLNGEFFAMRSLDDRFGCLALLEVLNGVKDKKLDKKVYFVWTVQEEIGLKGAKAFVSNHRIDVCYAIDSFACCSVLTGDVAVGKGPILRMLDNSAFANYDLMRQILNLAEKHSLPVQVGVTGGGTDGSVAMEFGAKMVPITLAVRYLHTPAECISIKDLKNLIELLIVLVTENV
ncbi:endoglucanase [Pseudothermotoga hypogea DSM 11164 = NBRC 106472]|uniref:Endoglucanase n=1 Tax=Pseudothermotoga hypogea DSM 11164 = NBRC 106472 TaxID=1123384 RepID=A0A0X1KTD0_9THEM|nr:MULTISPECIES: M42 family metallopeptidase [Pseudothermotoga]AJC74446.1 endoglucanase [Pseudothermotoga hypogea DSM 11164 = NBRC 106472]MBC7121669.1 M42 family metallopeptidase [Pseudothermotoga sp.]MDI6863503.1 M42 family metallopeptidase [Pseudothermotoga sp.]